MLESPGGLIDVEASVDAAAGKATHIKLRNQPAFVEKLGALVKDVPTVGDVAIDIAFGGMWYAVVPAASVGLDLSPANARELCRVGELIKAAAKLQHPVAHPTLDYPGPDILAWTGPAATEATAPGQVRRRNAVVMSNGELDFNDPSTWTAMLDRSPCGTGTCAVMAVMHAKGELQVGQEFVHESIIGTEFVGQLESEETGPDGRTLVRPTIKGQAWITLEGTVVLDATDPFPRGYTLGDIWSQ